MSGPNLHVFTYTQIFSNKKNCFSPIKMLSKFFLIFVYLYSMQFLSADPKIFSKKFLINFLFIRTVKNWPQKLLIIGPNPFIYSPKFFDYYWMQEQSNDTVE